MQKSGPGHTSRSANCVSHYLLEYDPRERYHGGMLRRVTATLCGGLGCAPGTRIGVHDVVAMIKAGSSVDEVVGSFPRLTRAQVYECLAYYEDHQGELAPLVAAQTAHLEE